MNLKPPQKNQEKFFEKSKEKGMAWSRKQSSKSRAKEKKEQTVYGSDVGCQLSRLL
ncbi:MAG: hypothetical protein HC892_16930 [Saprospiraceae bacterium]|nr:hypothetical protein [Saprospiraceae bacterium]